MTISYEQAFRVAGMMLLFWTSNIDLQAKTITPNRAFDKSLIKPRVENLDFFVQTNYNSDTERHIQGFVVLARKTARRVLGESTIYFPTIERKIQELGLPDDLKYLAVVESMLDPKAVSYAGAKGMWQLMPFTAADYKVRMDDFTDDRFHVEKSAHAGLSYLKHLYQRFKNWELALAAYNCGANRVRRIQRQTGKYSYWEIRHLLPRQTREYVPKLTAVKYLFDYYKHHGIVPAFPSIDLQLTKTIEIQAGKSYKDLGELTNLNDGLISFLNPSYMYEPKYADLGKIDIVLPARVADAVINHYEKVDENHDILYQKDSASLVSPYHKVIYTVPKAMKLSKFCRKHNLSTSQVWLWNELNSQYLKPGQQVFVYAYKELKFNYKMPKRDPINMKLSKIKYSISLIDSIPAHIQKENLNPLRG